MQEAAAEIRKARSQKKDYRPLLDRARTSTLKHQEVLVGLKAMLDKNHQNTLSEYEKALQNIQEDLADIK